MPAPRLIPIPHFADHRGTLSVVEWEQQIPFLPKRFYWIDREDPAAQRGSHCHWKDDEVVLALRGSFTVLADTGRTRTEFVMDSPTTALYIPAGVWHQVYGFSSGALCAVLASGTYRPEDDCHDYPEFLAACQRERQ
jgi:dTDP-4-dehydrorhamnose 3,5-epimerase-like enzyme